jgi:hypothetical protein
VREAESERGRGEDKTKRRSRKVLIKLKAPTLRDHENNPPLSAKKNPAK